VGVPKDFPEHRPQHAVGLDALSKGEIDASVEAFRFIFGKPATKPIMEEQPVEAKKRGRVIMGAPREKLSRRFAKQAPVPEGTVGNADKMRKEILQLSLFPDIYTKVKRVQHPGNTDFGEPHDQEC
jgi:hypothetical protein